MRLQVHQLVDQHVVADGVRHLHQPPVQADVAVARTRSPAPALIADADARDGQAVLRGQLQQPAAAARASRGCAQARRSISFGIGVAALGARGRCAGAARRCCFSIHACSRSANAAASRFDPQRGTVTRTRAVVCDADQVAARARMPDEDQGRDRGSGRVGVRESGVGVGMSGGDRAECDGVEWQQRQLHQWPP